MKRMDLVIGFVMGVVLTLISMYIVWRENH
jgi:heme/copper-type cytochrome/quinol oxidase subunit 4